MSKESLGAEGGEAIESKESIKGLAEFKDFLELLLEMARDRENGSWDSNEQGAAVQLILKEFVHAMQFTPSDVEMMQGYAKIIKTIRDIPAEALALIEAQKK